MLFRGMLAFLALSITACSPTYNEYVTNEYNVSDVGVEVGDASMGNRTGAQITELITTSNPLGSFRGDRLPNLQEGELEPGEYTIQFQVIEPPIDGLGFSAYAYVTWKVDGQQLDRIVSVFSGSAISGVANAVHVQLLDQSERGSIFLDGSFGVTNGLASFTASAAQTIGVGQQIVFDSQPGVFYGIPNGMNGTTAVLDRPYTGVTDGAADAYTIAKYKVGVTLSKGTRPATMQPPVLFTQNLRNAAPAGAINVLFPSDAGVISVLATAIVNGVNLQGEAANGTLSFFDAGGNTLTAFIPSSFPMWYPVPPGSVEMVFFNQSTTQTLNFSFQWGIEG
jgi:hypothetical protein